MTITNAWPAHDTAPCAESGEHSTAQRHPEVECPTWSDEDVLADPRFTPFHEVVGLTA